MSDFYNEKLVKTKKEHECLACGTTIQKGLHVYYNDGVFDGEFYGYYICEFCRKIFKIDKNIDYDAGIADSTRDNVEYSLGIWIDKIDLENKKVTYHFLKVNEDNEDNITETFEEFYKKYNLESEEVENE
jgi:hypothetical protein